MSFVTSIGPTILEAATALRAGGVTSAQLTTDSLARADEFDERLGVFARRFNKEAMAAACTADEELGVGLDRGWLHGIPIGVKDLLAVAEGPTTAGSAAMPSDWWVGKDAAVVRNLRANGAVIVGKTTTLEFAAGLPSDSESTPIPRNPWNTDCWSGGSSSGSASGVASGMFLGAVGTDTGASIRMPAAFCGISGFVPTFGLVPTEGTIHLSPTLDRVGPMARTASDCAALLSAMTGVQNDSELGEATWIDFVSNLLAWTDLKGKKIGIVGTNHFPEGSDAAAGDALTQAAADLKARGARITSVELPYYEQATAAGYLISMAEGFNEHSGRLKTNWSDYLASTRKTIVPGAMVTAADYLQAQKLRHAAQEEVGHLFDTVEFIISPTASVGAFTLAELAEVGLLELMKFVHTFYWNAIGNPVLSVPMGTTADGLPLGMQISGRPFNDAEVLAVGHLYQQQTNWHSKTPTYPQRQ